MDRALAYAASPAAEFDDIAIGEETCAPAPGPAREKRYADFAIGFVLSGWFDYRAQGGLATAAPGTVVFGNPGEHFSCRHQVGS